MDRPYSAACDRNRDPILAVLREHFADRRHVLEIGSGTGQHAVYFARALPHLSWQTSDRPENHDGIRMWLDEAALPNVLPPLALDARGPWPNVRYDAVFTANTLHIMSWPEVEALFGAVAPDHAHAPAGVDGEIELVQELTRPTTKGGGGEGVHGGRSLQIVSASFLPHWRVNVLEP